MGIDELTTTTPTTGGFPLNQECTRDYSAGRASRWSRKGLNLALTRAKLRLEQRRQTASPGRRSTDPIIVKDRNRIYMIPLESLDYVEAQGDYVAFHAGGRSYLKLQPISTVATTLDASRFVRIHRSSIVNLERVASISPYDRDAAVTLKDGTRLAMSRTGYARLLDAMEAVIGDEESETQPMATAASHAMA